MNNIYKYLKYKKKYLDLIGGVILENGNINVNDDCEICFDNFIGINPSDIIILCSSNHVFHRKCCEEIYKQSKDDYLSCPLCREIIIEFSTLENRNEFIDISKLNTDKRDINLILSFTNTEPDEIEDTLSSMLQYEFTSFKDLLYNSLISFIDTTTDNDDQIKRHFNSYDINLIANGDIESITWILYIIFDSNIYRKNIIFYDMLETYINTYININYAP